MAAPVVKLSEIRAKFPMYDDVPDEQLVIAVRSKFYPDIPLPKFSAMIDRDTQRAKLQKEATDEMSGVDTFLAGVGKAFSDAGQGVKQLFNGASRSDVDETKKLDAGLMATTGGMTGNVAGNVALAVPTVAIPGAAGLRGAAATGAALGGIQPVGTDDSRLLNMGIGAGAGAAWVGLARGAMGAAQGARALAEPFTKGGRARIAGRTIQRFADNPASVAAATSRPTVTGARPTLAEQTGDAGLARLQDSLRSVDPQIENQIGARLRENNAARVDALRNLAGADGARDFAVANRAGTAQQLYGDAFNALPDAVPLSPSQSRELKTLLRSPAIQAASKDARAIAANEGTNIGPANASGSIRGMHHMKMALDDAIEAAMGAGNKNKAKSIITARDRLVSFIEELSPDYKAARVTFANMSRPINQMDIAGEVAQRSLSSGSDLSGNPMILRNALMRVMGDEPALIHRATGGRQQALSDVLEPAQLNMLRAIASEADRAGAVATAGNGPGSATAQRMASQNVLRQIVGPTGLPQSWAENALANTVIGKPLNLLYGGVAEPKIQQALAQAVLDPDAARAVLQAAQSGAITLPPGTIRQLIDQAARVSVPALAVSQPVGR